MEPWHPGLDMTGVSISEADMLNGSPKKGDMIAVNPKNVNDKWLVAKKFFEDNYEEVIIDLDLTEAKDTENQQ